MSISRKVKPLNLCLFKSKVVFFVECFGCVVIGYVFAAQPLQSMANRVKRLVLSEVERHSLLGLIKDTRGKSEYRRVSAILEKADGLTYEVIATKHGVNVKTVQRWLESYEAHGIDLIFHGIFCNRNIDRGRAKKQERKQMRKEMED